MSQVSVTPLGDSVFVDLGESSLNSFGVDLPYLTDSLGGDAPANIPNPLASFDRFGPEPFVQAYVPYIPPPQTGCVVGCDPASIPEVITPEPGTGLLLLALILLGISFRKVKLNESSASLHFVNRGVDVRFNDVRAVSSNRQHDSVRVV